MTTSVRLAHGCSLSNLALFVAVGAGFMADEGLDVRDLEHVTDMTSPAGLLATGEAEIGTTAFTQPLVDAGRDDPIRIICGSGVRGIELLGQPGITGADQLRGRTVATFAGDPMEFLLHDALAAAGLAISDVNLVHVGSWAQAFTEFADGTFCALTAIEPHASRLRAAGAVVISDGTDVWGREFPDTVLVATSSFLAAHPRLARGAIRAMFRAEALFYADQTAAVAHVRRFFPDYTLDELRAASLRQPPRIDLRGLEETIYRRWPTVRGLGLASTPGNEAPDVIDFSFLDREAPSAPAATQ